MSWNKSVVLMLLAGASVRTAFTLDATEPQLAKARAAMYAARYDAAIDEYRSILTRDPAVDCYYELTRALLGAHRIKEAYRAADEGLKRQQQTSGTQTAAGLASFRKGEISKAEIHFRSALKLQGNYTGALTGWAAVQATVSQFKSARGLLERAYAIQPDDPLLIMAHANSLKGDEHIAMLEKALSLVDANSDAARELRVHTAEDRAVHGRKLRRLSSTYETVRVKLVAIGGPKDIRGWGLRVQFNGSASATLLLDTGASGISLSPKLAEKAGLELLSSETREAKGIGDRKPQDSRSYLAEEVRVGNLKFADFPVEAFHSAKDSDIDGLIGTDVFKTFLATVDFQRKELSLEPFATEPGEDPEDAQTPAPGYYRILRAGNHLLIPTSINEGPAKLFLIDSGSSMNLVDSEAAAAFTQVHSDSQTTVRGVQGKVSRVSRADRVELVFAGFRQQNSDVIAISLTGPADGLGIAVTGVLGMPVLSHLKLSINYRDGSVKLTQ